MERNPNLALAILVVTLMYLAPGAGAAELPTFEPRTVQGVALQVPRGWAVQSDDFSIAVSRDFADDDAPSVNLLAFSVPGLTPKALWEQLLVNIRSTNPGVQITPLSVQEERSGAALFALYQLAEADADGYLSAFSFRDPQSGTVLAFLFSAISEEFLAYGGPQFPMVVFGAMPSTQLTPLQVTTPTAAAPATRPSTLADYRAETERLCALALAEARTPQARAEAQQRCNETRLLIQQKELADAQSRMQNLEVMSEISRMSHETSMKILYNMGNGWCYQGEPGCN